MSKTSPKGACPCGRTDVSLCKRKGRGDELLALHDTPQGAACPNGGQTPAYAWRAQRSAVNVMRKAVESINFTFGCTAKEGHLTCCHREERREASAAEIKAGKGFEGTRPLAQYRLTNLCAHCLIFWHAESAFKAAEAACKG